MSCLRWNGQHHRKDSDIWPWTRSPGLLLVLCEITSIYTNTLYIQHSPHLSRSFALMVEIQVYSGVVIWIKYTHSPTGQSLESNVPRGSDLNQVNFRAVTWIKSTPGQLPETSMAHPWTVIGIKYTQGRSPDSFILRDSHPIQVSWGVVTGIMYPEWKSPGSSILWASHQDQVYYREVTGIKYTMGKSPGSSILWGNHRDQVTDGQSLGSRTTISMHNWQVAVRLLFLDLILINICVTN